jgi:hypothetical protein
LDTNLGDMTFDANGEAQVLWLPSGQQDTQGFIVSVNINSSSIDLNLLSGVFTGNFGDNGVGQAALIVLKRARA